MSDRLESLKTLLEKVEAGADWHFDEFDPDEILPSPWLDAFHGSLDAAKALHDEVLPEWSYGVCNDNAGVAPLTSSSIMEHPVHVDGNPARAWLIAILRALIARGEQTPPESGT